MPFLRGLRFIREKGVPILTARQAAVRILDIFESDLRKDRLDDNLRLKADSLMEEVNPRDRNLYTMLYKGAFRWKERLDAIISAFCDYPPANLNPTVLNSLRLGLLQITYLSRIPDHASVDEAVELVSSKGKSSKAIVNAVLREMLRHKEEIPLIPRIRDTRECIRLSLSYPDWITSLLIDLYGTEDALKYAQSLNEEEPLTLRVNPLKSDKESLMSLLRKETDLFAESRYCPGAIVVDGKIIPNAFGPLARGECYIQNCSSQMVASILDPQKGETILDACAGPGGKTTHIAEMTMNRAVVYALDLSHKKLSIINENSARLGAANIKTFRADSSKSLPGGLPERFDRILVDAPCTALGTLRKNPEIKWLKTDKDPARCAKLQLSMLNNCRKHLRQGGTMVYSVCTFTREETSLLAQRFLAANPDMEVMDIKERLKKPAHRFIGKEGYLQIPPVERELEPFFIAAFKRA